jgi:two-component system, cell cycle sensor histidine kinase and response regulator CckA
MEKIETQLQQTGQKDAIDAIAGGMIHDINNILSSILGFAELAKMGLRNGANVEKDLDEVVNAGLKARALVNQLSEFIRHARIRSMPIEVSLLIKETMKLLRVLLPASIVISFQPGDFKGKILANPVQFHHILIILLVHLSYAMKQQAGQFEICLKNTSLDDKNAQQFIGLKPGKYLQLSIVDRGKGMSAEILERSDAPFLTPECKESDFPGLFLVQGIVREAGGAVSFCKVSESGNIFQILFPKYEKDSDEETNGSIIDY